MGSPLIVGATVASFCRNGGIAWERLSWVLGLRRLGFDVVWVDQLDLAHCLHDADGETGYDGCLNVPYFERVASDFGLAGSAALVGENGESLWGLGYGEVLERASAASALVNLAGDLRLDEVKRRCRLKVYIDPDPGLTHLWLETGTALPRLAGHDVHFTIGENIGTPAGKLPAGGIDWHRTRQPLLLDEWPVAAEGDPNRLTTVGRWRGGGPHALPKGLGVELAQKGDEFMRLLELPGLAPQDFELALKLDPAEAGETALLEQHGWRIVDAASVAADPHSFRRYVQGSGGEFSVARHAYVSTWSGWFSDRTTRYLASGKPALVQDTGFSLNIPAGEGLLAFGSLEDAVAGARSIAADYERHSRAARAIAEEYFDSDKVLTRFAADAGLTT